jgi:hypothetical protein
MFLDVADFPALSVLSKVWTDIRAELLALSDQYFISWLEKSIYDGNWTVFPLYKFGSKVEEHAALCPKTIAAIERIPGLLTAGFSSLVCIPTKSASDSNRKPATVPIRCRPSMAADRSLVLISWDTDPVKLSSSLSQGDRI